MTEDAKLRARIRFSGYPVPLVKLDGGEAAYLFGPFSHSDLTPAYTTPSTFSTPSRGMPSSQPPPRT